MEETTTTATVDETPKRKRRGPAPQRVLTEPTRRYEKAHAKAERARSAFAKVAQLATAKDEAEREEAEAYDALQEAIEATRVSSADSADEQ